MKKFFGFFAAFMMLSLPCLADDKKAEKCFEWKDNGNVYLFVYFNNNESEFPKIEDEECKNQVQDAINTRLKDVKPSDISIAMIGSASSSGEPQLNENLAKARKDAVKGLLTNNFVPAVEVNSGESNASKTYPHEPDARSVLVIFSKTGGISAAKRKEIADWHSKLVALGWSSMERDVWKDKDGEFNTARLASDSIAGVVLGTAGGLISSHVIKKSQIKKGFEDIRCVIAGQSVADWGDLFQVGIQ